MAVNAGSTLSDVRYVSICLALSNCLATEAQLSHDMLQDSRRGRKHDARDGKWGREEISGSEEWG